MSDEPNQQNGGIPVEEEACVEVKVNNRKLKTNAFADMGENNQNAVVQPLLTGNERFLAWVVQTIILSLHWIPYY